MEKQITILTATYNRAHLLGDLYNSLRRQTCQAFDWVIVDDGSTDNTKEIVAEWLKDIHNFSIEYIYTPNGGKNRAINLGVKHVTTPYTMIVDSDDYLTDDAIEYLTTKAAEALHDESLAGISALKGKDIAIPLCRPMFNETEYITANNLERRNYNLERDACEVYKTDILRKHPFEVWEGEKFVPEEIVWNKIAMDGYSLRWYNKVTCIVRYQEEGLTKSSFSLMQKNPMGYAMMYKQRVVLSSNLKEKFYNACQIVALSILGKEFLQIFKDNSNLFVTMLALPFGTILAIRRNMQYKASEK